MKQIKMLAILVLMSTLLHAQKNDEDVAAVKQACFNYIDAFYKVDTTLAYASVHPLLQKRGFIMILRRRLTRGSWKCRLDHW